MSFFISNTPAKNQKFGVLLVANFLTSSNSHNYSIEFGKRLKSRGWSILQTSTKRRKLPRLLDMLYTVWKQRHEYRVAVIDVFSGNAFIWAEFVALALRCLKKPYILSLRGGNLPVFALQWPGRVKRLFQHASIITAPSHYLYKKMESYCDNLVLLPNSIDIGEYRFRHRENPLPRLIWLRAFHTIYNPELAPQVLSLLLQDYPDISLMMVGGDKGDGSYQTTVKLARDLGVSDHIVFPGFIAKQEIGTYLSHADIFLNTTNIDNTPISVMEAMACGLCVVSTNVGGIPYLLEDGRDALLVSPNDPESMANAVRSILIQPDLAKKLSKSAHEKVEQFDWCNVLPQWENIFYAYSTSREPPLKSN